MKTICHLLLRITIIVLAVVGTVSLALNAFMRGNLEASRQYWHVPESEGRRTLTLKDGKIASEAIEAALAQRKLAVIEFDDGGDYLQRSQRILATDIIDESWRKETVIYLYVHGWNHSSDPGRATGDLARFSEFILNLNETRSERTHLGIYLAWPGDPKRDILGPVSFPGRRAATNRMASPAFTDTLSYIRKRANQPNHSGKRKTVVFLGHSFGGRIVERTMTPSIQAYSFLRTQDRIRVEVDGSDESEDLRKLLLADLTILINPATEGLHARKLKLATQRWPQEEFPAIIALTSDSDNNTGATWAKGKLVERIFVPTVPSVTREYAMGASLRESVKEYVAYTVGHDWRLLNGRVTAGAAASHGFQLRDDYSGEVSSRFLRLPEEEVKHRLPIGCYLNLRVSKEILDGHSGSGPSLTSAGGVDLEASVFNSKMSQLIEFFLDEMDAEQSESQVLELMLQQTDNDYPIPEKW
ncbi:MAG: hypothetical protein AAGJ31_03595 [Verrucomicrobiota bacterium]